MKSMPGWLAATLRVALIALLPAFLILTNVRLAMSNAFLNYEYHKPDFPPDPYGFSQADRLAYAPVALAYLFNSEGIEFLGRQAFPDGSPQYNSRELSHMADVKHVTRGAMAAWAISGLMLLAGGLALGLAGRRAALRAGLLGGAAVTLLIFLSIIAYIALNFDAFFTRFHEVFFASGTWMFEYSDTLIRLFPLRFWQDAFVLIAGGAILEALAVGAGALLALRGTG